MTGTFRRKLISRLRIIHPHLVGRGAPAAKNVSHIKFMWEKFMWKEGKGERGAARGKSGRTGLALDRVSLKTLGSQGAVWGVLPYSSCQEEARQGGAFEM